MCVCVRVCVRVRAAVLFAWSSARCQDVVVKVKDNKHVTMLPEITQ